MTKANDLKLITLPEGEYIWTHMRFGNRTMSLSGSFKVKASTITYIGDITSQLNLGAFSASATVQSNIDLTSLKTQLRQSHPQQLQKYALVTSRTNIHPTP